MIVLSFASSLCCYPYAVAAAATCQLTFTIDIDHSENGTASRPEPIMLLELPIMLLSIIPKTSLLCLKLCSGILSDNMKFIRLN